MLFASRRFLQIVCLKKEGEKEQASSKVHAHAAVQVIVVKLMCLNMFLLSSIDVLYFLLLFAY